MDLAKYKIEKSDQVFYVPNFLTVDEEQYLIRKIQESPRQNWKELANRRLQLWGGQLTAKNILMAQPLPSFVTTYPDIIPRLQSTGVFKSSAHEAPNHIIMNEYLPGQGIMPHQDGPAYHPVVATVSLGSHTVFHYYQYKTADDNLETSVNANGRIIDTIPALSVLLEPRSVVITTGDFYKSYLHGIQEITEDNFIGGDGVSAPMIAGLNVEIANWKTLAGSEAKKVVLDGGALERRVRYSLTCRDVENVANLKTLLTRR
ncbi:hypothetical protein K435DRAFT_831090 [Dendrothele bispora CBS 962.96]|uniref:Fe2OG dioxygenase domain-containing protein n=1 Tax=Dendrothele bispora (strain CBS 962.96) TaxID=1314807 RepID=A0A4V4HD26_DENBC|nr:hypothetical protein K435DRAFT_831090 [Dendrothele bispora CBS 962.96]